MTDYILTAHNRFANQNKLCWAMGQFQVSNQDPGQGFKFQFPSFKLKTQIQVMVSSCNFQVLSSKPRSRSGLQVAIYKFQVSNQYPCRGFKLYIQIIWIPGLGCHEPWGRTHEPWALGHEPCAMNQKNIKTFNISNCKNQKPKKNDNLQIQKVGYIAFPMFSKC